MKRHTKAEYMEAAEGLALSLAIYLETTDRVERWLAREQSSELERKLLKNGWEQLRASRARMGVCLNCGGLSEHNRRCPEYRNSYTRGDQVVDASEILERR